MVKGISVKWDQASRRRNPKSTRDLIKMALPFVSIKVLIKMQIWLDCERSLFFLIYEKLGF